MSDKNFKNDKRRGLTVSFFATVILVACLIVGTLIFFRAFAPAPIDEKQISRANQRELKSKIETYQALVKKGSAEKQLESVLEIIEVLDRTPSQEIESRAVYRLAKGDYMRNFKKNDEATKCYAEARAILVDYGKTASETYCGLLWREGNVLFSDHASSQAIEKYQQSLSCFETMNGLFSPPAGQVLASLSLVYMTSEANQPETALKYLSRYEAVCNSAGDERKLELMNCHKAMAMAYLNLHKLPEAEEKLNMAREVASAILPADHEQNVHIKMIATQLAQMKSAKQAK